MQINIGVHRTPSISDGCAANDDDCALFPPRCPSTSLHPSILANSIKIKKNVAIIIRKKIDQKYNKSKNKSHGHPLGGESDHKSQFEMI